MLLQLDVKSITGFSSLTHPDAVEIDLPRLQSSSPQDTLKYLTALRWLGMQGQFKQFRQQTGGREPMGPLAIRMFTPINPLLLLTAISVSVTRNEDYSSVLKTYASGLDIPVLDTFIRIDFARDEKELESILELEDKYREAILELGVQVLVPLGRLIQETGLPTMFDIYWACWLIVNPAFQNNPLPTTKYEEQGSALLNGWRRGIDWGFKNNSLIHNAREYHESSLNGLNEEINRKLERGINSDHDRAELEGLTSRQHAATVLVERARRLYQSAPHEIEAFSGEIAIARELNAAYDPQSLDESDEIQKKYGEFLLPRSILEQIVLSEEETDDATTEDY